MGLPYAESADDDVMYSQERDLEGGVHVAICHPAVINEEIVSSKIRNVLMSMAGNTVLILYRGGVMLEAQTFICEIWTAEEGTVVGNSIIDGELRGKTLIDITTAEIDERIGEIMESLNDKNRAVVVRFGKKKD
ncbi:hypothetical protein COW94_02040 [Candidatus Peregrinibacteria bacterium CG22_combo_CG10-13_8_21_14_all_44_10]|nr:MAG: hypothetical protein AUK45_02185 [Candidatus Peregrinibacteria bacterium CG2_30_44_17]PIP66385.1 MAG: hypothetical protein COW94_02040 [Candidatus Peregrinibacteria bacterium CG22_combo_CG10-13_8_21_14_all_44_10]PIX79242.1 MAG: hypothetical protein COZ35_03785 [Candidatus Peregrinibacteria bacterium CG_4_10_14_3_um_filter_44_21]PJB88447.1 MAG: hypothetical protein CO082_04415 [Candidatus Peregrinibacteria bacterium CG_4_9_14_0_8_um_filter_44_15]